MARPEPACYPAFVRILLKVAALLVLAAPAWADRVTLTNGYVVEGKASEAGEALRVELRRGWVAFPRDRVASIEKAPTPWEVYAERTKGLAPGDVPGQLALARWCLDAGLPEEARRHRELALAADPECEEARLALGFHQEKGRWVRNEPPPAPPPAVKTAGSDDEGEEERPLERFSTGSPPSRAHRYPVSSYDGACYAYGAAGYYPVHPGSVWHFPWGTVYGSPLLRIYP